MDLISGTRVRMYDHPDITGWVEFPEPHQTPPAEGMVLVLWDNQRSPVWEYVEALVTP